MRHLLGGLSLKQPIRTKDTSPSYAPTKLRVTQELQAGDIDRGTTQVVTRQKKCDTILSLKQPIRTKDTKVLWSNKAKDNPRTSGR